MSETIFKIISSLNSEKVKSILKEKGYTYSIAPMENYNSILRNKVTLDYNIKLFNATSDDIDKIADYIILKVFNDDFIKKMIVNKILMLSFNVYDVTNSSAESFDCKSILDKYLGRAIYSYSIENSNLKLIIDIPKKTNVSRWKPVLMEKKNKIFVDFKKNNIELKNLEIVFSYDKQELDDLSNTFLEIGFIITKAPND